MQQTIVFFALAAALVLFITDRWRYDLVALFVLLGLVIVGIIPSEQAFAGFAHPAVVTVAAILIVSQGLANSGVVDGIAALLGSIGSSRTAQISALTVVVTVCSAFMNNVGALALLMPVAIRMATENDDSPSILLMPLAFGSLLGGMTTLIGTPPNIIIGSYREQVDGVAFGMFDYSPVGLGVAVCGIAFIALFGWRLIPIREGQSSSEAMFRIEDYTTELVVPPGSPHDGQTLEEVAGRVKVEFVALAIVRGDEKILAPSARVELHAEDHVLVEVASEDLDTILKSTGFELAGQQSLGELEAEEIGLVEAVVLPRSRMVGRSAPGLRLRAGFGINLLAVSRQGVRIGKQLKRVVFQAGDVLLIQGATGAINDTLNLLGCLPIASRPPQLQRRRRLFLALGIFAVALGCLVARVFPAQIAFSAAALAMVLTRLVKLREAYAAIDWPVVVLLGAMIPVGGALESTGGAALIAEQLMRFSAGLPTFVVLAVVLALAMFLSDVMNNAATAVIMAPIAVSVAQGVGGSPDAFLMAVAVGASCAFLTPIGHQSNTLVMGPGGYRFGDYWRLGLPLELLIIVLSVPLLMWFW